MRLVGFWKRYPEIPFVLITYGLMAALVVLVRNISLPFEPLLIVGSWTPNIAAFVVVGLILRERGGIRRLFAGWTQWRIGARWYLVAFSPLLVAFLAAGIYLALGGAPAQPTDAPFPELLIAAVVALITGAMGEELGWRGFLLPRLQARFGALLSSLLVGVVWALWHLPLWTLPDLGWDAIPFWSFGLTAVASSVLITFVLNNTGGSLVMATIIHFSVNFGMNVVAMLGWLPDPSAGWTIAALLYAAYAVALVAAAGPATLTNRQRPFRREGRSDARAA